MSNKLVYIYGISTAIVLALLLLAFAIDKRFSPGGRGILSGLLVGKDNRLSLSKFQAVLWTMVTITSYVALKAANIYCGFPINTSIPANLLVLLGMNATTTVLARGITGYITARGSIKLTSASTSVSDLYMSDDSRSPDIAKFQMICWTIVALVVYYINFFSQCGGEVISLGFPDIESPLLYLMILGHGAYLGDKALNISRPKITGVIPLQVRAGEPFSIMGYLSPEATAFTLNKSIPLELIDWNITSDGQSGARVVIPPGAVIRSSPAALTAITGGQIIDPYYLDVDLTN